MLSVHKDIHQQKLLLQSSAEKRIEWALQNLPANHIVSSSFGIQSAVMLHMMTTINANIPIILIDTGHLFPETYQYVEQLTEILKLNLHVCQAKTPPRIQEKMFGKLWPQGKEQLKKYHFLNKIEPFEQAMVDLKACTWFSGVRSQQSEYRKNLPVIEVLRGHYKVHPIIDWNQQDIHAYFMKYKLPYHPLKEKGYVSVGDVHSTQPLPPSGDVSKTRFSGRQRECGLHL